MRLLFTKFGKSRHLLKICFRILRKYGINNSASSLLSTTYEVIDMVGYEVQLQHPPILDYLKVLLNLIAYKEANDDDRVH